jgi:menaquinone-specific isochorismate synthase
MINAKFEQFKEVVNYFEETQIAKAEHDETLGNILRMEDIYVAHP